MLKVLVVLPLYGGSLSVGRFAVQGLKETGCLVDTFEAPAFYPSLEALKDLQIGPDRLDGLQNSFLQVVSQAVLAKVDAFEPDLVLCMAQAPMSRATLKRLRRDGVPTAMWFVEDFRLFTYWRAYAPYYDLFAVIQKEPFPEELAKIGMNNVLYLPLAALPAFHRPLELTPEEKTEYGSPLSFVGAGYINRRKAFLQLMDKGLKIWGTEWEDEPNLAPVLQRQGARVSSEDCVRIFNASDININLHSSVQAGSLISHGDFVNPRTFEVACCGAFQLTDKRSLMPELFSGDEMAVFDSLEELQEQIAHYAARPEERKAVAARARARVLKDHTYAVRMQSLLDFAAARLPGFGQRRAVDWPANMPPAMRDSVMQLMQDLDLPSNADFTDLVTAVRSRPERLSDAEAAVLFLDEWKKQYLS